MSAFLRQQFLKNSQEALKQSVSEDGIRTELFHIFDMLCQIWWMVVSCCAILNILMHKQADFS